MLSDRIRQILTFLSFPKIINQNYINNKGIKFEVTNPTEEWRVNSLDDEEDFLRLMLDNISKDDIIFDIGACIGIYSLHLSPFCKLVYSFEPDPKFQKRIKKNIKLNSAKNIILVPYAVSNSEGVVDLFTDGVSGRSPSMRNFGQNRKITIKTRTIDRMISTGMIQPPDVVKMDIEGAEYLALLGMSELLGSSHAPRQIFIEIHPEFLTEFDSSSKKVLEIFQDHNYQSVYHKIRDKQEHYVFQREG